MSQVTIKSKSWIPPQTKKKVWYQRNAGNFACMWLDWAESGTTLVSQLTQQPAMGKYSI